jgi:hypothetical protein
MSIFVRPKRKTMNKTQTTIWGIVTLYVFLLTKNPFTLIYMVFIGAYISKRIQTKKSK